MHPELQISSELRMASTISVTVTHDCSCYIQFSREGAKSQGVNIIQIRLEGKKIQPLALLQGLSQNFRLVGVQPHSCLVKESEGGLWQCRGAE